MKYYKYIKIILILIPIVLLGIFAYKDFNFNGNLKVDYDFCQEDPFISKFSPLGRVLEIEKEKGGCWQKMVIDPVYFDVRLPQKFETAVIKIWYKKTGEKPFKIGPVTNMENWQWQLKDINYLKKDKDWSIGYAQYDLTQAEMNKNRLRFMISAPGLDKSGSNIIFDKIEIEFDKKVLSRENWWQRIKEWISFSNIWFVIND